MDQSAQWARWPLRTRTKMNAPERIAFLPDIQPQADNRALRIDAVGINGLRYPVAIRSGKRTQPTIATFSMTVALPAAVKGTHMSRLVEVLEAQTEPLDQEGYRLMLLAMLKKLEARSGTIEVRFPYFVKKTAPVSAVQSRLDYEVRWRGSLSDQGRYTFRMTVTVPATSLCPCSKEISEYGAHNQRSQISIEAELAGNMTIEQLIAVAERSASCEVYGLLKRPDEKYVTEHAYDNPKFVEDIVRDAALALNQEPRVGAYVVEAENFESIHNHSAFARIVRAEPARPSAAPFSRQERQHLTSAESAR